MLWSKIESHDKAKNKLLQQLRAGRIGHAYLFVGKKGIGKKLVAKAFSADILDDERYELVLENKHPDLMIWETDKKSFGVALVRELQRGIHFAPTQAKRKVIVINEGEKLTIQAQNALLKILEEPPESTSFIILTDTLAKILTTIVSRCQIIRFSPLDEISVKKLIDTASLGISEEVLLLKLGRGSVNNTTKILAEVDLVAIVEMLKDVLESLHKKNKVKLMQLSNEIASNFDVNMFLSSMEVVNELAMRGNKDLESIIGKTSNFFKGMDYETIIRACKVIINGKKDLEKYISKQITIETIFIELMEVYND